MIKVAYPHLPCVVFGLIKNNHLRLSIKKICLILMMSLMTLNSADMVLFPTKDYVEVTNKLACISINEVKPSYTPVDLFYGLEQCLDSGEYEKAATLYNIALVYLIYDTLRVSDRSSHQLLGQIILNLRSTKQEHMSKLDEKFKDKDKMCQEIKRIQIPTYFPRYMIQSGTLIFFQPAQPNNGLVENFNSQDALNSIKIDYMKCQ